MLNYDFEKIEKKWQKKWETEESFKAVDLDETREKFYCLYEFFNVSGNLHMGHLKAPIPSDALSRMKRLQGFNVLFPIGGDAFGLPAENAAIKTGCQPSEFVEKSFAKMIEQCKKVGLSFDYSRTICSSEPEYFKWTQWIFLKLLENGKAYKKNGTVNFCPSCNTVLSNEDCQGGVCDRCGTSVVQQEREVWFLKMKEYAEKLLKNVDAIEMTDGLKEAQRNWIGKSEGVEVVFELQNVNGEKIHDLKVFTTCVETIFGVTYMVVAPEQEIVRKFMPLFKNKTEVEAYVDSAKYKSTLERISQADEKTGCKLDGIFAVNPLTNKKVPVYIADFVVATYGTGAVMSVPAHDQRDFEFAKKFGIETIQVIEGNISSNAVEKKEYLQKNSLLMNSGEFSQMPVKQAKKAIAEKLESIGKAKITANFKIGDWPFNRQRYWGEPFPVVFCKHCGTVALSEKDLPLLLPKVESYKPSKNGESALAKATDWVNCICPKCGRPAKRETDTMPNWAGSSWYWLRYVDPHNKNELASKEKLEYWGEVDCYTGGTEHITRHVLYAFFWQNFLFEIGAVPSRNPFKRKMGSGLILDSEGKKMSKSSANGVTAMEVIEKIGTDATRLHVQFLSAYEDNSTWTFDSVQGIENFLNRVWNLQNIIKGDGLSKEHAHSISILIEKVTADIEDFKLNTAIAALMGFIKTVRESGFITKEELSIFLILLNPIAPHITSEIFETVFGVNITTQKWPIAKKENLVKNEIEIPVQVNGKKSKVATIAVSATKEEVIESVEKQFPDLFKEAPKKIIFVPGKIINLIK